MSHFTVMVIGDDVESQLAPYQENNMGDCPEEYLSFHDQEDEFRAEYESESQERIVMPDGRLLLPWDEEFRTDPKTRGSFGSGMHAVPEGLERRKVPFKETYPTLEEFVAQWHGYKARDEETQRYGYWENAQKKWDWYQIGGRWSGMLLLKPGARGEYGERSWTNEDKADDMSRCDQARKGDIDIDGMRDEAGEKAGRKWDAINQVIAPHAATFISWETCVERSKRRTGKEDYQIARDLYHGQPLRAAIAAAANDTSNPHHEMFCWLDNVEDYLLPREEHVQRARDGAITTFAYLDSTRDPAWVERGQMGWFAFVRDEKDKAAWDREFNAYFDSLPDDTLITIVDCHI